MLRSHAVRRRTRVSIRRLAAPAGVILPRRMQSLFCLALSRAHPGGIGAPFRSFDVASSEVWASVPKGSTPRPRSSDGLTPKNAGIFKRYAQFEGARRAVRGTGHGQHYSSRRRAK